MTSTANLDRLRAAYSDVRWDEAAPLVDFQRAEQVESFRIVAADGHDINEARSIADLPAPAAPGERALAASFADASETLVFDAEHANGTAAPGDWREFGVLLVNVRAPSRPVDLNFTVTTTTVGASAWTQVLHLDPGWNALRIDLNDLGRRVDLGHVRTLTWRLLPEEGAAESAVAPATTLYFNGLVLAHRTRWIVGRDAKPGELYVFARGARIVVGSREHFELAFVGGALIAWYVGGSDNLALPSGLGPWPVVLRPGWEQAATPIDLRDLQRPGSAPHEAGQRLLEASSWRVVITNAPAPPDQDAGRVSAASEPAPPPQTWQYAIYADGRAFVQATSTKSSPARCQTNVGSGSIS